MQTKSSTKIKPAEFYFPLGELGASLLAEVKRAAPGTTKLSGKHCENVSPSPVKCRKWNANTLWHFQFPLHQSLKRRGMVKTSIIIWRKLAKPC